MNTSKVIELVVNNDLCIGCGLCVSKCSANALEMKWNEGGFLVASAIGSCNCGGACLEVCPFNPFPKAEVKTENELGALFLRSATNLHQKIGRYTSIYAGYSAEFRLSSSSGGLGTYICREVLENKIANHIFSIRESTTAGTHYEYAVSSSTEELVAASKTRYFPVTLATVFSEIKTLEGTVAIVGVGCFIKAIRLAQHDNPLLKEKITFLVGIICGGVKSRFFTEYLGSKMNIEANDIQQPQFRQKDLGSTANDYSFSCSDNLGNEKSLKMTTVGDLWGTGLFKANACDFCDDVTTELADISLGDAWLHPFYEDGKGTNVIVTRSKVAEELMNAGIANKNLVVDFLPLENFLASQQGSFNHRHLGMPARIKIAKEKNQLVPPKRYEKGKVSWDFQWVQKQRMVVRAESLKLWKEDPDAKNFDQKIKKPLDRLQFFTKIYHKRRNLLYLKGRLFQKIRNRFSPQ